MLNQVPHNYEKCIITALVKCKKRNGNVVEICNFVLVVIWLRNVKCENHTHSYGIYKEKI